MDETRDESWVGRILANTFGVVRSKPEYKRRRHDAQLISSLGSWIRARAPEFGHKEMLIELSRRLKRINRALRVNGCKVPSGLSTETEPPFVSLRRDGWNNGHSMDMRKKIGSYSEKKNQTGLLKLRTVSAPVHPGRRFLSLLSARRRPVNSAGTYRWIIASQFSTGTFARTRVACRSMVGDRRGPIPRKK